MKYGVAFILFAMVCVIYAVQLRGLGWALLWASGSFGLVAAAYLGLGPTVFGKRDDGELPIWSQMLLFPYLLYTWGIWHLYRLIRREHAFDELVPDVLIGRRLLPGEYPGSIECILDLTAEFMEPRAGRAGRRYRCFPILDGSVPDPDSLAALVRSVASEPGTLYIHCAQGHGRTAMVAAALLIARGLARDTDEAICAVLAARPSARLNARQRQVLDSTAEALK